MDTIAALSSGALPAGIAVIRLSGPDAFQVAQLISDLGVHTGWAEDRKARLASIFDPLTREKLDRGLVLAFKAPHSFTGEDVVELHLHGSRAIVDQLLASLSKLDNVRLAEPGEYTRRAFVNGKMDIVATEALGDLIQAETQSQRRLAFTTADGQLVSMYRNWRDKVLRSRAMIEADIDFADEEDVPGSVADAIYAEVPALLKALQDQIKNAEVAERVREGFRIVIFGPPNAGKSTLLNALAGREAAIVTDIPGTTRDMIEVQLELNGYLVRVVDTAGIRETDETVEKLGVDRALGAASEADLVLNLSSDSVWSQLTEANQLMVLTKADLRSEQINSEADVAISAKTGWGMDDLLALIGEKIGGAVAGLNERAAGNRRHVAKMQKAVVHLGDIVASRPLELNAESFRLAGQQLSELTGEIGNEEILGEIFSSFCIGK